MHSEPGKKEAILVDIECKSSEQAAASIIHYSSFYSCYFSQELCNEKQ